MQLKLADGRGTLTVDSALDGFDDVVRSAADAAKRIGLSLDATTDSNLAGLGHGNTIGRAASGDAP